MTDLLTFVVLLGSLRAGSLHRVVANALPTLAPAGVTIEPLESIGDTLHYSHDVQDAGFPSEVSAMVARIAAADGVVIVTPEYNYSVPGVLKNALDWLSRFDPQPFASKPVAIQTGSPGTIGGARAQYHLRQTLVFLDAKTLNKPEVMIGQMGGKVDAESGTITDETVANMVRAQLAALAQLTRLNR